MIQLDDIAQAVQHYDLLLKIVGAIAAPGGIWFWIDKYRNRIRIKVRNFQWTHMDLSGRGINFELENVGTATTSLEPMIHVALYSRNRERITCAYRVDGAARKLPPHELVHIQAWHTHTESNVVLFGWFMVFTLVLTRGRNVRVYIRNAEFKQLPWLRFQWERLAYKFFGKC